MTGVSEAFFKVRVGLNGGFEVSEKYLRSFTDALHRLRAAVVLLTSIDDEDRSELKFNATAIHVRFQKVWRGGAFAICMPKDCSRRSVAKARIAGKGQKAGAGGDGRHVNSGSRLRQRTSLLETTDMSQSRKGADKGAADTAQAQYWFDLSTNRLCR